MAVMRAQFPTRSLAGGFSRAEHSATRWIGNIIYFYVLFFMLLETINGVAIYKNIYYLQSFFVAIKIIFFILFFLHFLLEKKANSAIAFVITAILLVLLFLQETIYSGYSKPSVAGAGAGAGDSTGAFRTVQITIKIALNFLSVFYFKVLYKKGAFNRIRNVCYANSVVLFVNLILSFAGVGFGNYSRGDDQTFGGTGFFYAGNEVSAALILATCSLILISGHRKYLPYILLGLSLLGSAAILSRTAMFGALIVSAAYIFFRSKKIFSLAAIAVLGALYVFMSALSKYFEYVINRWDYFVGQTGLVTFLFGGQKRISESARVMDSAFSDPVALLIGTGWTGLSENNFFDLVEMFGFFGLVIFVFWCRILLKDTLRWSLIKRQLGTNSASYKTSVITSALIVFISILAGHVVQSSLILPFLGILYMKASTASAKL